MTLEQPEKGTLVDTAGLATGLAVHTNTVLRWIREHGDFPVVLLPGENRYDVVEVRRWLTAKRDEWAKARVEAKVKAGLKNQGGKR
jgi:hypothetical protein